MENRDSKKNRAMDSADIAVTGCTVTTIVYLYSRFSRRPFFTVFSYVILAVTAVIFLLRLNRMNMLKFIKSNKKVAYIPKSRIDRTNGNFLRIYLLSTVTLVSLLIIATTDSLSKLLSDFFNTVMGFILRLFFGNQGNGSSKILKPEKNLTPVVSPDNNGDALRWLALLIQRIFSAIATVAIILLIIYLVFVLIRRIFSREKYKDSLKDKIHEVGFSEQKVERKKPRGIFERRTTEEKIRDIWYKKVKKGLSRNGRLKERIELVIYQEESGIQTGTPSELEEISGIGVKNSKFHDLYLKARYSNDIITEDDLKEMKRSANE